MEFQITAPLFNLDQANQHFAKFYPGDSGKRQPIHTVYGGAQLFKADTIAKIGSLAIKSLTEYAPDFVKFASALELPGHERLPGWEHEIAGWQERCLANLEAVKVEHRAVWLAYSIYRRVMDKLAREPVEDFRIDFEDGYGYRTDEEEDGHACLTARETALAMAQNSLPPFFGIRIKPLSEELHARSLRTLNLFLTTLLDQTGGKLPTNLLITLPKVTITEQVAALVSLFDQIEERRHLTPGTLQLEIMIETPQSLIDRDGRCPLPSLVAAARGRCFAAHLGVYDYTASCNVTATYQGMEHPLADFARHVMQVSLANTGIHLSDSATNVMPIGPHRVGKDNAPLTLEQRWENRHTVQSAWRVAYRHVRHSLRSGLYQGWDLHPAQIPVRYAAVYAFFFEGIDDAKVRLTSFLDKASQASLVGNVFDDAATGQGLLNFFLRGISCGAITEEEARTMTGLTLDELRTKSFMQIMTTRRSRKS